MADSAASAGQLAVAPQPGLASPASKQTPFVKLFRHADGLDILLLLLGTAGALANGCIMPLFALSFGDFTDGFDLAAADIMPKARQAAVSFVYLAVGVMFAFYIQAACWIWSGERQARKMREAYLQAVMRQDVAFFETQTSTGALLQGLNEDTAAFQAAISERMGTFVQLVTTFVVGFIVAFFKGWDMTLVLLACLPFLGAVGAVLAKLTARMESSSAEAYADAQDLAQQAITQVRTVAAYGTEDETVRQYNAALELPEQVGIKQGWITGLSLGSLNLVLFCAYAGSLYYGATRVAAGSMTGGSVLAVMMSALLGSFSLGQAAPLLQYFIQGRAAAGRLFAMVQRQPAINVSSPGEELAAVSGALQLLDVVFAYPARPEQPILRGLNLTISAGRTVALVGSSGSGKSTVVGLLQRLYDPSSGTVTLDGVDIRRLQLKWLRSQMALVSQEVSLFASSIYDNIAMGRPGASREEVLSAARAALVDCFVSRLPQGYDTHVGSRGLALSGGQRQRIAIARAILRDPKILLLDEATSALDAASEAAVGKALHNLASGITAASSSSSSVNKHGHARSVVMVAHRLSTVRNADVIVVMGDGRVLEQGSHNELIGKPDGAYAALVKMQNANPQDNKEGSAGAAAGPEAPEDLDAEQCMEARACAFATEGYSHQHSSSDGSRNSSKGGAGGSGSSSGSGAFSSAGQPKGWLDRLTIRRRRSSRVSSSAAAAEQDMESVATPKHRQEQQHSDRQQFFGKEVLSRISHADSVSVSGSDITPDNNSKKEKQQAYWRLLALSKNELPLVVLGGLGSIGHGTITPAFAMLLTTILAMFYIQDSAAMLQRASMYAISLAAIGASAVVSITLQQWAFAVMGQKLARRVRTLLLGAILHQEIGWHDLPENAPAKVTTLLSADAACTRGAVGDLAGMVLQCLGTLAFGYGVAFACDWRMALLVTGLLPLLVSGAIIQTKYVLGSGASSGTPHAAANAAVGEALAAIHVVHAYNLQDHICEMYNQLQAAANASLLRGCHVAGLSMGYSQASLFIVIAVVVYFGGIEVASGRASFEQMMKAFLCVVFAALGVAQALVNFPELSKAGPAAKRIFGLLDRQAAAVDDGLPGGDGRSAASSAAGKSAALRGTMSSKGEKEGKPGGQVAGARGKQQQGKGRAAPGTAVTAVVSEKAGRGAQAAGSAVHHCDAGVRGEVQLVSVSFSYPARPNLMVLINFSLKIPAGSTFAVVGPSGSGKSTLISLLQRFYDPASGAVLLDGVDIRRVNLKWLRQQMGLVSQECLMFKASLLENIAYGFPGASLGQVVAAAQAAHAHDFITALPQGYDTLVGGKGCVKLSGGQRQRIAIARAIIRNPRILLLDEATSALDAASEAVVAEALADLAAAGRQQLSKPEQMIAQIPQDPSLAAAMLSGPDPPEAALPGRDDPCDVAGSSAEVGQHCKPGASPVDAAMPAAAAAAAAGLLAIPRTTIIVAHRLVTVRGADVIAVMSGGQLQELGSHEQLMAKGPAGQYVQLVSMQCK